jgi:hypothetical protein
MARESSAAIVARRGLCSMMDDSRWQKLLEIVAGLPFPPPYTLKSLTDSSADRLDDDVEYWGDYTVLAQGFEDVEWVCVRPTYLRHRGTRVAPERVDCTRQFREALKEAGIPFEEIKGAFLIFGYR